jgi:hypothetical protein
MAPTQNEGNQLDKCCFAGSEAMTRDHWSFTLVKTLRGFF